jgi:hypothetical protein
MHNPVPENLDALLTRDRVSEALTASGFPTKPKTLSTKASRGGGPPYVLFGQRALYRWGDALAWARARLSKPQRNTSEADLAPRFGDQGAVEPEAANSALPQRLRGRSPRVVPHSGAGRHE